MKYNREPNRYISVCREYEIVNVGTVGKVKLFTVRRITSNDILGSNLPLAQCKEKVLKDLSHREAAYKALIEGSY